MKLIVNFFRTSGKWYSTEEINLSYDIDYNTINIGNLLNKMRKSLEIKYSSKYYLEFHVVVTSDNEFFVPLFFESNRSCKNLNHLYGNNKEGN